MATLGVDVAGLTTSSHPKASVVIAEQLPLWDEPSQVLLLPNPAALVPSEDGFGLDFIPGTGADPVQITPGFTLVATEGTDLVFSYPNNSQQRVAICDMLELCSPVQVAARFAFYPSFGAPGGGAKVHFVDTGQSIGCIRTQWTYYYSNDGDMKSAYQVAKPSNGMMAWFSNKHYLDAAVEPLILRIESLERKMGEIEKPFGSVAKSLENRNLAWMMVSLGLGAFGAWIESNLHLVEAILK